MSAILRDLYFIWKPLRQTASNIHAIHFDKKKKKIRSDFNKMLKQFWVKILIFIIFEDSNKIRCPVFVIFALTDMIELSDIQLLSLWSVGVGSWNFIYDNSI